jgi:hypothetical protein
MANPQRKAIPLYEVYESVATNTKTYTVPDNQTWFLNWAHLIYTSTADVGDREIEMFVKDSSGNTLLDVTPGAVQAASNVYHYYLVQGIFRETSFSRDAIQVPIPKDLYLGPGYTLQFVDDADIAVGDSMVVSFQALHYEQ